MTKYILRLDDICPTMNPQPFQQMIKICQDLKITGILGVIPYNQDSKLQIAPPDPNFWPTIKALADQGWIIAQHGYQHLYTTANSGLLKFRSRSEFAGLSYQTQLHRLAAGQAILEKNIARPITWWMAPAHSFDHVTCQALISLKFTHITDGIALYPFKQAGLTWIPHQIWKPELKPFGLWTVGLHLNTITPKRLQQTISFIKNHSKQFQNPDLSPRSHLLNPLFKAYWYAKFNYVRHRR